MTLITENGHFHREEFACKCGCGGNKINPDLVELLEIIRLRVNKPVIINCGYRCPKHNNAVGGKEHSQHLLGNAADIRVIGLKPIELHNIVEQINTSGKAHVGGLGLYRTFVHVDVREGLARWCG